MISEVICDLIEEKHSVAVCAITGKATAVLRKKVYQKLIDRGIYSYEKGKIKVSTEFKDKLSIETIQKTMKSSRVVNISIDGVTKYKTIWKDPKKFPYEVLIIDELSMVPYLYSLWWQKTNAIVIGLGDFCQLPEVQPRDLKDEMKGLCEVTNSQNLSDKNIPEYGVKVLKKLSKFQLTKILRSNNEVAKLCADLRDFSLSKMETIKVIKKWAEKAPKVISYSKESKDVETGKDWQIVCFTNKMCSMVNEALCLGGEYPISEDKILLFDNIPPINLYNGDITTLADLNAAVDKYNEKHSAKISVIIKWKDRLPYLNSPHWAERKMAIEYAAAEKALKEAQLERWVYLGNAIAQSHFPPEDKEVWRKKLQKAKENTSNLGEAFEVFIEEFCRFFNIFGQNIIFNAPPLPNIFLIEAGYGYAITVHKSQGSQYEKVCYIMDKFDHPLLYTAVSRAKRMVKVVDLSSKGLRGF